MAKGGEILTSLGVRELCGGKGFLFADRGEHAMRGYEDPVRVFEISWQADERCPARVSRSATVC